MEIPVDFTDPCLSRRAPTATRSLNENRADINEEGDADQRIWRIGRIAPRERTLAGTEQK